MNVSHWWTIHHFEMSSYI